MIQNMEARVDGRIITFVSSDGLNWLVSSVSPDVEGVYPVTLTITSDSGVTSTYTVDDEMFGEYLKMYVTNRETHLIRHLPPFLREVWEFKKVFAPIDDEIDILYPHFESAFAETIIMYCSEKRIREWEKDLHITPIGTLMERRYYIKAMLRGSGKLNEARIKSIVEAFTGGDSIVTFKNSVIDVKVLPPNNDGVFRFPDVERTLKPLIPAHLGLSVKRYYSTWKDIKNNYLDWNAVNNSENWNAIKNWIAPYDGE